MLVENPKLVRVRTNVSGSYNICNEIDDRLDNSSHRRSILDLLRHSKILGSLIICEAAGNNALT
jgi:hypothetical protein